MIMMNGWTLLWLIICLTVFVTILESIHKRLGQRRLRQEELELQRQIHARQYNVFTLERITVPPVISRITSAPSLAEQQFIHEQQELRAAKDLPPRYEDVVAHIPSQQARY